MAAKKTAKKATPAPAPATPAPVAKKAAKKAAKKTAVNGDKVSAKKTVPVESLAAPAKKAAAKPPLDALARAAYLNYRRRVEQGLPGDSHGDWLEAERQFKE